MAECKDNLQELCIRFPGCKPNGCLRLGMGIADTVGNEAVSMTKKRVLLLTDPTIVSLKLHERVLTSLQKNGLEYDVFSEIQPEPHIDTMNQLQEQLFTRDYGIVIGLGGGSALDVAKLAAVMAATGCSAEEIFDNPEKITASLPTILMPTTSGTGSEVSPYSVMAQNGKKRFITSSYLYADVAMVDPEFTMSMPPRVTATTGLDALTHGVEGAIGKDNPYTRAMMLQCVKLVFQYLPRAVKDGNDREARYYMSLASVLGMFAYTQGGGLYAHSMSYILTTGYGCPHGLGCGLSLPYTLQLNRSVITELLLDIGTVLGKAGERLQPEEVIKRFHELVQTVGVPSNLASLGVEEQKLDEMAKELVEKYYRALNPVALSVEDAKILMRAMYEDSLSFEIKNNETK